MPEFQPYLDSIALHYDKWWRLYTLTDAEGQEQRSAESFFDFGLMVQTITPKDSPELGDRPNQEKIERFPVTEGLQKYAIDHVLLVGRPGSGKSTALARLMLDLVRSSQIPVLVELRSYQSSILELIRSSFKRHDLSLTIAQIEMLLDDRKLILLIDGVNELPSESARMDLSNFRQNHSKVSMIFTTRDLSLGGNLGIEKQLEMQPLTETQMRSFINAYLPGKADAMLGQLKDRLREFGTTPLLLWMLCSLFKRTEVIPQNLGEVFRAFTRGYEQQIKHDVVLESDRRLWFDLLKQLAAAMMQGEKPTEFRVAIAPVEICAVFADYLKTENPLVPRQALDDLLKHHLIQRNGELVEFRHQLIQEYYAAEWLLDRIRKLDDETLDCDYLNYLKWTEPLALMLALVDDEALAVRVVERSLAIDLMLGARLAGEVRSEFQEKTIDILNQFIDNHPSPEWLKIKLLGQTRSKSTLRILKETSRSQDDVLRDYTAEALGHLNIKESVPILMSLLEDNDDAVRISTVKSLGMIGSSDSLPYLIGALKDESPSICLEAIQALSRLSHSDRVILKLLEIVKNTCENYEFRQMASQALAEFKDLDIIIPEIVHLLQSQNPATRKLAIEIAGSLNNESILKELYESLADRRFYKVTVKALEKIGSSEAVRELKIYLKNDNDEIRRIAACALGRLGQKDSIPELLKILQERNCYFSDDAVYGLGVCSSKQAIPVLKEILLTIQNTEVSIVQNGYVLKSTVVYSLSKIEYAVSAGDLDNTQDPDNFEAFARILARQNNIAVLPILRKALKNPDSKFRETAAYCLALMGFNDGISILMNVMENSEIWERWWISEALVKTNDPEILKQLWEFHKSGKIDVIETIQGIQTRCEFYNYEIHRKTIDRTSTATARGVPQDCLAKIEQGVNQTNQRLKQMAEQPTTISISGGTFNGPVNLASNQGTQPTTIIDTQNNNYFSTDETLQHQIAELQQLITELETQHPNLQTEAQATQIVQQTMDQLQTQNPDRWQKLRDQMTILKQQFFNPDRHTQALKATIVEVTKTKWEDNLLVKAIVTYLDKFSETPDKGA